MRLFLAVRFDTAVFNALTDRTDRLEKAAKSGNFTRPENLHLTLVFLGETGRDAAVRRAMDSVQAAPFALRLGEFGRFSRPGGEICWVGVKPCPPLTALQRTLSEALRSAGFSLESRAFRPHITLGRAVVFPRDFDFAALHAVPAGMTVDRFSLMKSERINGRLTYTALYERKLQR